MITGAGRPLTTIPIAQEALDQAYDEVVRLEELARDAMEHYIDSPVDPQQVLKQQVIYAMSDLKIASQKADRIAMKLRELGGGED